MKTLHERCAGLDVHKREVVACLRLVTRNKVSHEVRRFATTEVDPVSWTPAHLSFRSAPCRERDHTTRRSSGNG